MTEEEKDFLLLEFKTSWIHLGKLDDRRFKIFQYYSAFFGSIVGLLLILYRFVTPNTQQIFYGSIFAFSLILLAFSWCCYNIVRSEREAAERYRDKVNAIRRIFVGATKDPNILEYIRNGPNYSVRIDTAPKKKLSVLDLFNRSKWATALFVKVFIDFGIFFSGVMLLFSLFFFVKTS